MIRESLSRLAIGWVSLPAEWCSPGQKVWKNFWNHILDLRLWTMWMEKVNQTYSPKWWWKMVIYHRKIRKKVTWNNKSMICFRLRKIHPQKVKEVCLTIQGAHGLILKTNFHQKQVPLANPWNQSLPPLIFRKVFYPLCSKIQKWVMYNITGPKLKGPSL